MFYKYGMKLRGFSIGCQPKEGFVKRVDSFKYHDVLIYNRMLTPDELFQYDLEFIGTTDMI